MDSEEEALDDLEFNGSSDDEENEIDEDILDALEEDLAAEEAASEAAAEDSNTDDSDNDSDDDDNDDEPPPPPSAVPVSEPQLPITQVVEGAPAPNLGPSPPGGSPHDEQMPTKSPTPTSHKRSTSPAGLRKAKLLADLRWPRSFTVEAICAIPHPAPTHCLASSLCMSHVLTGSDDGYIRDYDIFSGVNGKVYLTAPQRHHCGVMEGLMKAAQIRLWFENPVNLAAMPGPIDEPPLCAPYSLLMHSDALWALAGTELGHINLFTVRHEPGRLCHIFPGHRGPVSSMSMAHDEKGFFSAGWDGEAIQWDLNTGQIVRNFTSHGSQLTAIGVRPLSTDFNGPSWIDQSRYAFGPPMSSNMLKQEDVGEPMVQDQPPFDSMIPMPDDDDKSDFDPLFDDPDADGDMGMHLGAQPPVPKSEPSNPPPMQPATQPQQPRQPVVWGNAPNAPPVLDPVSYNAFSPDVLMTAAIDGQVMLWDRRVHSLGAGVGRLPMGEKTRPWCVSACWSADGSQIYVGRRNAIVDVWDVRQTGSAHMGTPRLLKTLRNPPVSGDVSCVVAFPDGRHLACASNDNIRLWNVADAYEPDASGKVKSGVQFKIIPGHHGGIISQMLVDRQARFLISASSNRGWHGESTKTVFVHEVKSIW
ncbi:WD40 repeat-like protein [Phanerochaete sordida]|uniref:WD40 repeat-like protein n=1 Tax=Phanerochaete sordida TaxID=48140 RepID=A0A9P3G193_9APHY|nr:WD40 repeat-like protein [Phanerochaete sordida]